MPPVPLNHPMAVHNKDCANRRLDGARSQLDSQKRDKTCLTHAEMQIKVILKRNSKILGLCPILSTSACSPFASDQLILSDAGDRWSFAVGLIIMVDMSRRRQPHSLLEIRLQALTAVTLVYG